MVTAIPTEYVRCLCAEAVHSNGSAICRWTIALRREPGGGYPEAPAECRRCRAGDHAEQPAEPTGWIPEE